MGPWIALGSNIPPVAVFGRCSGEGRSGVGHETVEGVPIAFVDRDWSVLSYYYCYLIVLL